MKKIILILFIISILLFVSNLYAAEPKFKLHILNLRNPGVNYSINYPVVIDYDNDGDLDIVMFSKEGIMYFFENLLIK